MTTAAAAVQGCPPCGVSLGGRGRRRFRGTVVVLLGAVLVGLIAGATPAAAKQGAPPVDSPGYMWPGVIGGTADVSPRGVVKGVGSKVPVAGEVFVAAFTGTLALLEWQFGDDEPRDDQNLSNTPGGSWGSSFQVAGNPDCLDVPKWGGTQGASLTSACVISAPPFKPANGTQGNSVGTFRLAVTGTAAATVHARLTCGPSGANVLTSPSTSIPAGGGTVYPEVTATTSGGCTGGVLRVNDTSICCTYVLGTPVQQLPPPHIWRTEVTCPGGQTITHTSETFYESDADLPPIGVPPCPEGLATGVKTWEATPTQTTTGSGGALVVDWVAPAPEVLQQFSECLPGGPQAPCVLTLWKVGADATTLYPCAGELVDCTGYDALTSTEAQYRCQYGTYAVPLSDCSQLQDLQQTPGETTEPGTGPGTGSGANPSTGDPAGDSCMGAAWSWNPVKWVYVPIKCALTWAFVPRESVLQPKLQAAGQALDASPFGQVGTLVGGVGQAVASLDDQASGNCHGPRLPLRWQGDDVEVYPVDACPGTWGAYVAPIIKTLSTLLIVVGAVLAAASTLGGAFGVRMPWSAA